MLTEDQRARMDREYGPVPRPFCVLGGHNWQFIGGKNCGCEWMDGDDRCHGNCSVPVHKCEHCGDCDYGDNDEANDKRQACQAAIAEEGLPHAE